VLLAAACDGGGAGTTGTAGTSVPTAAPAAGATPRDAPATVGTTDPPTATPSSPALPATTAAAGPEGWSVDTGACLDPGAADAPITGTVRIGSVMPLSGGPAATVYAPVAAGFRAYVAHADAAGLLPAHGLELAIDDDRADPQLTPGVVAARLAAGAQLFAGIAGAASNEAVRDALNAACIPQLFALTSAPVGADVRAHPWTIGQLVPAMVEARAFAAHVARQRPQGATVAVLHADDPTGVSYADALVAETGATASVRVVAREAVGAADPAPPAAQVAAIAASRPDVVVAAPVGVGCIGFLVELAASRALAPGWAPEVYVTSSCAARTFLRAAGPAADGVLTSSVLVDPADPASAALAGVVELERQLATTGLVGERDAAAVGWTTGELTVAVLRQAAASPTGLTRASIIEAARAVQHVPSLARPGVVARTAGEADPFPFESLAVVRYDAATGGFQDVGELITTFER